MSLWLINFFMQILRRHCSYCEDETNQMFISSEEINNITDASRKQIKVYRAHIKEKYPESLVNYTPPKLIVTKYICLRCGEYASDDIKEKKAEFHNYYEDTSSYQW